MGAAVLMAGPLPLGPGEMKGMHAKTLEMRRLVGSRLIAALAAIAAGLLATLAPPMSTATAQEQQSGSLPPSAASSGQCLDCHGDSGFSTALPNGERVSLFVDEAEISQSVHQGKLGCTDCHSRISGFPHKGVQVSSRREYSLALYEACKRCHFTNYTKTLDSIHYTAMDSGNQNAPLCTDCHGYHNVSSPNAPRSKISQSCAGCHTDIYETYARSVHGSALVKEENGDVPVCTDCHGTHTIRNPATASFRLDSPGICGSCHADEALMRRYGLSPNVFKTYLHDFHGTTVTLTKQQGSDNWTDKAVCSDCHGVHNISSVKGKDPTEIKQNVVTTCQKCHPSAGTNFPDAWLSHYDLSMETAPLPYLVRTIYVIAIPMMIGGLMLHILVDLWRVARNR